MLLKKHLRIVLTSTSKSTASRPLSMAAILGRVDVARRLLELGADVNSPCQNSPWLVAARQGTAEIVEVLLLSGRVNTRAVDTLVTMLLFSLLRTEIRA
jgi:ankyrin repeat protein